MVTQTDIPALKVGEIVEVEGRKRLIEKIDGQLILFKDFRPTEQDIIDVLTKYIELNKPGGADPTSAREAAYRIFVTETKKTLDGAIPIVKPKEKLHACED